jgi:phenylalanyl-tRNA synthetase beta chain
VPPQQKSIAIAITLQPRDKTLTDAQIDAVSSRLVDEVRKRTGGVLRA